MLDKKYYGEDLEEFQSANYQSLKQKVSDAVIALLEPMQQKYKAIRKDPLFLFDLMALGAGRANALNQKTLCHLKTLLGIDFPLSTPPKKYV